MPDTTEEQLRLELAACQFYLASARLHLNTLRMQHLTFAHCVQSVIPLLTQTSLLEPYPLYQKMVQELVERADAEIEQLRRACAVPDLTVPDMTVPDPYDLRTLGAVVNPNMASNSETGWEREE